MLTTVWIIISVLIAIIAVMAIMLYHSRKDLKTARKEHKELQRYVTSFSDAWQQASKDKSEVRTGNHSTDLDLMLSKLRLYANRKAPDATKD